MADQSPNLLQKVVMSVASMGAVQTLAKTNIASNTGIALKNNTPVGRMLGHGESFWTAQKNANLNQTIFFAPKDAPNTPYKAFWAE